MTLSPVTGRRPDYTVFSVDIGVTDVTRNRRLFAVTSTTCSTLLKELVVVTAVFSPPIDIKHYSSPAHPVSVLSYGRDIGKGTQVLSMLAGMTASLYKRLLTVVLNLRYEREWREG